MPSNEHAIRVGNKVRGKMAEQRLSQQALASRLQNVTQQKLSRCISGQQSFKAEELQQVADALGVSVADLLPVEPVEASA